MNNIEERREKDRLYREKNREKYNEYHREYQKKWREKHQDYQKIFLETHPDYFKEYYDTKEGKAVYMVCTYNSVDVRANRGKGDLTPKWVIENILSKPCHYNCGETDWHNIGCDRIDNDKPHTMDNVVPCCEKCNKKRGKKTYEDFIKQCGLKS